MGLSCAKLSSSLAMYLLGHVRQLMLEVRLFSFKSSTFYFLWLRSSSMDSAPVRLSALKFVFLCAHIL